MMNFISRSVRALTAMCVAGLFFAGCSDNFVAENANNNGFVFNVWQMMAQATPTIIYSMAGLAILHRGSLPILPCTLMRLSGLPKRNRRSQLEKEGLSDEDSLFFKINIPIR